MSFWASFTGSLRNFGHRIARIFTRKKNRHLENTKPSHNKDQNKLKTDNTPINISENDSKYVINILNDPIDEKFQRCTSSSLKVNPITFESSTKSLDQKIDLDKSLHKIAPQMEGKSKDINQIYREMEEAVAQKVRETMELADARRALMLQGKLVTTQKEITVSVEDVPKIQKNAETTPGMINILDTSLHNATKNVTNNDKDGYIVVDGHLKKEQIQQEFDDITRIIEEEQGKMYKIINRDDEKVNELAVSGTEDVLHIGFEDYKTTDNGKDSTIYSNPCAIQNSLTRALYPIEENHDLKDHLTDYFIAENPSENAPSVDEYNSQIGFEEFGTSCDREQDSRKYRNPVAIQNDLAGASHPTEDNHGSYLKDQHTSDYFIIENPLANAPSNYEHKSQIGFEHFGNQISLSDSLNLNVGNIDNLRDRTQETTENTLNLRQDAIKNAEIVSANIPNEDKAVADNLTIASRDTYNNFNNPFEITRVSDSESRIMGDNSLNLAGNTIGQCSTNPFGSGDDSVEIKKNKVVTNIESDKDQFTNPFNTNNDQWESREFDKAALNIAQTASRSYGNPFSNDDMTEDIKQLGADALNIAQKGAATLGYVQRQLSENPEDLDNAFNSLIDFEDLSEAKIGFEQFAQEVEDQTGENYLKNKQVQ